MSIPKIAGGGTLKMPYTEVSIIFRCKPGRKKFIPVSFQAMQAGLWMATFFRNQNHLFVQTCSYDENMTRSDPKVQTPSFLRIYQFCTYASKSMKREHFQLFGHLKCYIYNSKIYALLASLKCNRFARIAVFDPTLLE